MARIAWGEQLLTKHVNAGDEPITDAAAAAYLAKYATKATEVTGYASTRISPENVDQYADPDGTHVQRLIDACWRLGRPTRLPAPLLGRGETQGEVDTETPNEAKSYPYTGLRRWAHMFGYGGHFLTKAQRYSTTFGQLRAARANYRRVEHNHDQDHTDAATVRAADHHGDQASTLVVGLLSFAGTGWHTTGDALLANTSAALARARRQTAPEELTHEIGSTLTADQEPVAA